MKNCFVLLFVFVSFMSFSFAGWKNNEKNKIIVKKVSAGKYIQFIPGSVKKDSLFVFLIHGMIIKDGDEYRAANYMIHLFKKIAAKKSVVLVAPMFNQKDYGSNKGPMGGYRALQGRNYTADVFLNQIVDNYKKEIDTFNGEFILLGHSAGAQFVSRYIHNHPEKIIKAILVSAGSYLHPDMSIPYPHGCAWSRGKVQWDNEKPINFEFKTTNEQLKKMTSIPIFVIVGKKDKVKIFPADGHLGSSRISYAKGWINSINDFANKNNVEPKAKLIIVDNANHSLKSMMKDCYFSIFNK